MGQVTISESTDGVDWAYVVHASQPRNASPSATEAAMTTRRRQGAGEPYRSARVSCELTRQA